MTTPTLTRVEQAILGILASQPAVEVSARDLRGRLRSRGFHRTAPSLVFTMMGLEDKGLVSVREEVQWAQGAVLREQYYSLPLEELPG